MQHLISSANQNVLLKGKAQVSIGCVFGGIYNSIENMHWMDIVVSVCIFTSSLVAHLAFVGFAPRSL